MNAEHQWTAETARITVRGLDDPVRLLHLTDVHCTFIDERDAEHLDRFTDKHRKMLTQRLHDPFEALLSQVADIKPDVLVLSGDIIHFPSYANIEYLRARLNDVNVPTIFTCGNHDWQFPAEARSETVRTTWWPRLDSLTGGQPSHTAREIKGLLVIALDNSTYQVSREQLEFIRTELAQGLPTVVVMHIPLSQSALRVPTIKVWGSPILMADPDWDVVGRKAWDAGHDKPETVACADLLRNTPNVLAILSGHIHFDHAEPFSATGVQYVGRPPFTDLGHRVIDLVPQD